MLSILTPHSHITPVSVQKAIPADSMYCTQSHDVLCTRPQPPTPCTTYGGPLTDYTVQFRVFGTTVYQDNLVSSNATSRLLSSLSPNTRYEIKVAAHTMAGRGSFTSTVTATTSGKFVLSRLRANNLPLVIAAEC